MSHAMANLGEERKIVQMDRWPILVVYSPPNHSEEELRNHLEQLGEVYDTHKEPYVLVLDARSGRRPNAVQRKMQSDFREKYGDHIKTFCRGTAFVTSSEILKGAATAMFWIKKPTNETKFFTNIEEAFGWAEERLRG